MAAPRMTVHPLVTTFYGRIWNAGDYEVAGELLCEDLVFRGSLGSRTEGIDGFLKYVHGVRQSLAGYRCEILTAVTEDDSCFARVRCSGHHVAPFRGVPPTGRRLSWDVAALFTMRHGRIAAVWVLGDLENLERQLRGVGVEA
jgi:steroid delta-isomerase-like uncharacterized protein